MGSAMNRSLSSRLSRFVVAVGLALSLTATLGAALNLAAADRVAPGGNTFQRECRSLQDEVYQLYQDYKNYPARRSEILTQLREDGLTWKQIGCQAVWGDIRTAPPVLSPRDSVLSGAANMTLGY